MLDAIRKRFPPPIVFHIDCNGGYDLKEDFDFLSSLDQYELAMIEQPLNPTTGGNAGDLLDHAELASIIKTPICLDESINSLRSAEQAIELGSAQIFNIKPGRCGGITIALQIMALAKQYVRPSAHNISHRKMPSPLVAMVLRCILKVMGVCAPAL